MPLLPRIRPLIGARRAIVLAGFVAVAPQPLTAQQSAPPFTADQSVVALQRSLDVMTTSARVLIVGMHPDDEPSELITWLSRGHNIETAYLSVTRGEAGHGYGGEETGALLGAVRTEEALAARRIDGAEQFYTRAYDFGAARNPEEVFKQWNRDSVVGDIVAVIRSFRPQVIVAMLVDSAADVDGQHLALTTLMDHAFTSSADAKRFPATEFGTPWPVAKMFRPGPGLRIKFDGFDRMLGVPLSEISLQVRAQQRSEGLAHVVTTYRDGIDLRRIASRVGDSTLVDTSFFGAVDTSFKRLQALNSDMASELAQYRAVVDSVRRMFDPAHLDAAVPYLARAAALANTVRAEAPWCRHPSASALPRAVSPAQCEPLWADVDASIDRMRESAVVALLGAARVSFEATADRELLAGVDTASVMVTMQNHGAQPATLVDIAIWGNDPVPFKPITVAPDSAGRVLRRVANLAEASEWWIGLRGGDKRGGERFAGIPSAVDGLSRSELIAGPLRILGVAIPENIRRNTDANVSVTVGGTMVTTSIGPFIYRYSDAVVGLQNRPLGGIPDVTLQFARGLDWFPRNRPTDRSLRVSVKSHSDRAMDVDLKAVAPRGVPKGLHVDSLPPKLHLDAHEERDLYVKLRGKLIDTDRTAVALQGSVIMPKPADSTSSFKVGAKAVYQTGLRTMQRSYLPPLRILPSAGEWIQPVDIEVPALLSTLYVTGVSDDIFSALKQVGVWATEIASPDQLLSVDLSKISTVAIGPFALEAHPELLNQTNRLHEFVRRGGTLVVLRGENPTVSASILPFPIALNRPFAERIAQFDAPVVPVDRAARVLNWPNKITDADWADWIGSRALAVPSIADTRYQRVIESHDPEQQANRNSILVTRVGKGTIVYTSLTLDQQIAGGVPGAMRLLVNLLSAGLPAGPTK